MLSLVILHFFTHSLLTRTDKTWLCRRVSTNSVVEHQFNCLSIGLKAYKCGFLRMKMAVIYINLWYFKCTNNKILTTMDFDVFRIDSLNIAAPHKVVARRRKKKKTRRNSKSKRKEICYRKEGTLFHLIFTCSLELWGPLKATKKKSVCVYPVSERMIMNQVIRPFDRSMCVSLSNNTKEGQLCLSV